MRFIQTTLFFAIGAISSTSVAWVNCIPTFERLAKHMQDGILSTTDRNEIAQKFDELPHNEAARFAFDRYVEKRLASLPEEIQYGARELLATQVYVHPRTGTRFHKGLESGDSVLNNATPENFRGTAGDYMLQAHELEHYIQFAMLDREAGQLKSAPRSARARFLSELGAMTAEWEYLHSIPEKHRLELVERVKRDWKEKEYPIPGFKGKLLLTFFEEKGLWISFLKDGGLTREQYITRQHEKGRYSQWQTQQIAAFNYLRNEGVLATKILGLSGFSAYMISTECDIQNRRRGVDRPLVRKICQALSLIPE